MCRVFKIDKIYFHYLLFTSVTNKAWDIKILVAKDGKTYRVKY